MQMLSSLFNNSESHLLSGFLNNVVDYDNSNTQYPPFFPPHTPLPPQSPSVFEPQITQNELDAFVEYYHRSNSIDSNSTLSQSDINMHSSSSASSYNQLNQMYPQVQQNNFHNMMSIPHSQTQHQQSFNMRNSIAIPVPIPVPVPVPVLQSSKPPVYTQMETKFIKKPTLKKSQKLKKEPQSPKKRGAPKKELLTAAQRRANHIASEQKRRGMIRKGFEDLSEIVPDIEENTSKAVILALTHQFIENIEQQNKGLELIIKDLEAKTNGLVKNEY
jgi:hypothetical protein